MQPRPQVDALRSKNQTLANSTSFKALGLMLYGLVGFQSFHMVEHAMLYIQFYVQGLAKPTAIIEFLFNDTVVQVHFVFNLVLYVALVGCLALYLRVARIIPGRTTGLSNILLFETGLYGLFLFQTVHMFDHGLQYFQLYVLDQVNPKGLFGQFIDESNIAIHIVINGIILAGLVLATLSYLRIRRAKRLSSST